MGKVIGDILPLAIGIGISPIPIVAVILMLGTRRGRVNGPIFLLGWVLGIAISGTVVLLIAGAAGISDGGGTTTATYWIKLALGVLLLLGGLRRIIKRPAAGEEPETPKWMSSLDRFSWIKALGAAGLLGGVNPKNLALIVAAAAAISQSGVSAGAEAGSLAVLVAIASIGVLIPVVVYFAMGERAVKILDSWKSWLVLHNSAVMAVLFLVFGFTLIGKAVMGLT